MGSVPTGSQTDKSGRFSITVKPLSALSAADQCRLDRNGQTVIAFDPGAYRQLDLDSGTAGAHDDFCAYCYGTRAGQAIQSGLCLQVLY